MIKIKNNSKINLDNIPKVSIQELRNEILEFKKRPIGFFGKPTEDNGVQLFAALADDQEGAIYISSAIFSEDEKSYESLTKEIPAFHIFEREFYEQFGIEPLGHPWLKPVRNNQDKYEFFEMQGEDVHQVAVGPIHAGVIEPGHFRFMCNGETVYHLEIMLGYQHRGIEDLMLKSPSNQLAESICGDSVIAHNLAYSKVMEQLRQISIPQKAELIRIAALEMERMAIHIGDLGAIAGDIAYLMGASVFGATRTLVINTMLEFCGSRFGRGLISVGGVNYDFTTEKIKNALTTFEKVIKDVERMTNTMLKNSTVMSRLEKTGTISMERAEEIGLVGMAARAAGVNLDSRFDFPDNWISELNIEKKKFKATGDVNARFKLRYKEILQSYSIIKKVFAKLLSLQDGEIITKSENKMSPDTLTISIVEGWRGEIVHIAITDTEGKLARYKIKDASFNNWYGLALAVRNNGVSDFPLCNKSFNLSYSGNDL
ncbi:MAG: NADH-quinone oxidoreductase subunit C [Muribaculaceae bacterium]|nr:NADH-quinone oxidoreductase subunit C [Muribaculaceae bacterium]